MMTEVITHEGAQYRKVDREAQVGDKVVVVDTDETRYAVGDVFTIISTFYSDLFEQTWYHFAEGTSDYLYRSEYATLEPLADAAPTATDAEPGDSVRIIAAKDIEHAGYEIGDIFEVVAEWPDRGGVDAKDSDGRYYELYAEEFEVVRGDTAEGYADRLADALIQAQNDDVRLSQCVVEPDGKLTCKAALAEGANWRVGDGVRRPAYITHHNVSPGISTQKSATAEVTQAERIEDACRDLSALLVRKNHDYGDSFAKQYEKYGLTSALIRMDDKLRRLETLNDGEAAQVAESVEDTLIDLAGYALLAAVELRKTT